MSVLLSHQHVSFPPSCQVPRLVKQGTFPAAKHKLKPPTPRSRRKVEFSREKSAVVAPEKIVPPCRALGDASWREKLPAHDVYLCHPTFQITCAISFAVLTVSTTFRKRPVVPMSSLSSSSSAHGMNIPDEVRCRPSTLSLLEP